MGNNFGTYAFLSWLRRGISTGIGRKDVVVHRGEDGDNETTSNNIPRATISVNVSVGGAPTSDPVKVEGLALYGPGEITGIDPRVVIRPWPKPEVFDAEDNYFPMIEFDQPDLPWRYTPASADDNGRLRPWICLIALKDDEYELDTTNINGKDRPLPVLIVNGKAPLPKLSQAWAWAHVQVSGESDGTLKPDNEEHRKNMHKYLTDEPYRVVARLLCPRRLNPKTVYTVFLVPTFERGRKAGLGEKVTKDDDALTPSWQDDATELNTMPDIKLPVYYSWRFQTGLGGDFEYLVSLLKMGIGSSDFSVGEFKPPLTIGKLCEVIKNDGISLVANTNTIDQLNELLTVRNLFEILREEKPNVDFSKDIMDLVDKTKNYRNNKYLNNDEQHTLKRLNQLLLEETYPQETPKSPDIKGIGTRDMDVQNPGAGLSKASANSMGLEGALKIPGTVPEWGKDEAEDWAVRSKWIVELAKMLNGPTSLLTPSTTTLLTSSTNVNILTGASDCRNTLSQIDISPLISYDMYTFAVSDWDKDGIPDLIIIKKNEIGENNVEVQILSGKYGFQRYLLRKEVNIPLGGLYAFAITDLDNDGIPDLIAMKANGNYIEVHIFSGKSGEKDFEKTRTIYVPITGLYINKIHTIALGYRTNGGKPCLFVITKEVDTRSYELHIFSTDNTIGRIFQCRLPFLWSDDIYIFTLADWNGDELSDLIAIKKGVVGEHPFELQILSGNSGFQEFLLQTHLPLRSMEGSYMFAMANWCGGEKPDLFIISRQYTREEIPAKRVVVPLYGRWHAKCNTITTPDDPNAKPQWFHELSIDPRLRVAAGVGTYVVQTEQQQLMASAWRQVEGIRKINNELRQSQLAREAALHIYERDIKIKDAESLLTITAPVHGRVLYTDTDRTTGLYETKTVKAWLKNSPIAKGIFEAQWRRVIRPYGPIGRRQGRIELPRTSNILERMNQGELSPAKAPTTPSNMSTFKRAGLDITKLFTELSKIPLPEGPSGNEPREYYPGEESILKDPTELIDGRDTVWEAFGNEAKDLFNLLNTPPNPGNKYQKVDITKLKEKLIDELDSRVNIENSYRTRLKKSMDSSTWRGKDPLGDVMAAPTFQKPMYEPLRDLSQEWLLPGLDKVPPNTMSLLETNERFIEAYMVGLNHEMARELLWNGYPTDQRGSYFRKFWDTSSYLQPNGSLPDAKILKDIEEVHKWEKILGKNFNPENPGSGDKVVLLIRGELLLRYPNALIYATKAKWIGNDNNRKRDIKYKNESTGEIDPKDEKHPIFSGTLKPDVSFFAFDLKVEDARGNDTDDGGYFFVLQERPSETRFGLNTASIKNTGKDVTDWEELSWGHLADEQAQKEEEVPAKLSKINYIDLDQKRPIIESAFSNPENLYWHASVIPQENSTKISKAADIARITLQEPVRVAVHASDMLPKQ